MRLYYFTTRDHGLQNIERRRIKVARMADLNDPFEFIALKLGGRVQRQNLVRQKIEIDSQFGLICFSDRWSNPLMWSNYADRHRGICLGFDVANQAKPTTLRYIRDLPSPASLEYGSVDSMTDEQRMTMGFVKSVGWKYERERRLIIKLADVQRGVSDIEDARQTHFFQPFNELLRLREVIVGARCQLSEDELQAVIGRDLGRVDKLKARLAFESFKVVTQQNPAMWHPSDPTEGDGP